MKHGSTLFLKGVIWVMGIAVLAFCIFAIPVAFKPENIRDYGPILLGMCVSAIPFFIALFQALKLLNHIDTNKAFSDLSIQALKKIKYCAVTISTLYTAGIPYIFIIADQDDAPGAVAMGLIIIGASIVVAVFAAVLQKLLQSGLEIQSENDLTV